VLENEDVVRKEAVTDPDLLEALARPLLVEQYARI
jgi:hypothetical protein